MCGFAGHLGRASDSIEWVNPTKISHRGPDQAVVESFGSLSVTFFRLSINGVSNGQQPFVNQELGLLTAVNGEIYNHQELRRELEAVGAVFATDSDAEVVHWGFHYWGLGIFQRLEGMFAVVIFERETEKLTFARDRLGKKPLYWADVDGTVSFASELGALSLPKNVFSPSTLASYMLTDAVAWEAELGNPVRSLAGGHWAQLSQGQETIGSFWNLENAVLVHRMSPRSRREWYEGFIDVVTESVAQRLMSEVPVGLFLSDGKDSRLIAALASDLGRIDVSYTLKFDETSFDESSRAAEFAQRLNIPHEMVRADVDSLTAVWELYRDSIDEPFADSAILGELLLARAAAPQTKVVLTGDGGDETLLGYQQVVAHGFASIPGAMSSLRCLFKLAQPFLGLSREKYFSAGFVANRFLRGAGQASLVKRDLAWRSSFSEDQVLSLVNDLTENDLAVVYRTMNSFLPEGSDFSSWQDQWAFFYLRTYLHHVILRKVDRGTMRFGVEARSPLLDRRVVEYTLAMPTKHKRSLLSTKLPIKYALNKIVGPAASQGKKHGMGVPLVTMFRGPLKKEVASLNDPDFLSEQGLFAPQAVGALIEAFGKSPQAHVREIWSLLVFQNWWKAQSVHASLFPEDLER